MSFDNNDHKRRQNVLGMAVKHLPFLGTDSRQNEILLIFARYLVLLIGNRHTSLYVRRVAIRVPHLVLYINSTKRPLLAHHRKLQLPTVSGDLNLLRTWLKLENSMRIIVWPRMAIITRTLYLTESKCHTLLLHNACDPDKNNKRVSKIKKTKQCPLTLS